MATTSVPRLQAEDVSMRFGRNVLFRRLRFQLEGGQTLAVTGPNGSGKSTLLRILAGLLTPDRGNIRLSNGEAHIPAAHRALNTGLVAPYLNVYDGLTARENLQFLSRARRLPNAQARIDEMLAFISLTHRADDYVSTFSSGMKQRVKFASALLSNPLLLLLDEPSSNLDAAGLAMLEQLISQQKSAHKLLIIATNDAQEAAQCDRSIRVTDYR